MPQKNIIVKGAREHNLKNVDDEIPRDKREMFTGPCGSRKTSQATVTIYAQGQKECVESQAHYAKQLLDHMTKPQLDYIEGNDRARRLYDKVGFVEVARVPDVYRLKDGSFRQSILMMKKL